jgi:hypothetical protein
VPSPPSPSTPGIQNPTHSGGETTTSATRNVRKVNRRVLPIDEPNNPKLEPLNVDQGGEGGPSQTAPPFSGFPTLSGSSFGFGLGAYVLNLTGLDHLINWMASFMPVRSVIGKQPDDLTQRGIAHLMLIGILVMFAVLVFLYIVSRSIRNRRGTRGQLRKIALVHYFGDPLSEQASGNDGNHNEKPSFLSVRWMTLRHWIYRFMRSTGFHRFTGKQYSSGVENRKKWL